MKIAFDAKRAYENETGLGNYSRTLISSMARYHSQHQYYLCSPKVTSRFNTSSFPNIHNINPHHFPSKVLKSGWRSNWVKRDLRINKIDLYHGLSHEIPIGIHNTGIKAVVTIHDLIFERYPEQYNWLDVQIYRSKFTYACKQAHKVIAISKQTKEDIIHFYKIPEDKIEVCYQSCNPSFAVAVSEEEKLRVRNLYNLPDKFFLYVGSIIERKNLLNICKAISQVKDRLTIPLIVIGEGRKYEQQVKQYITENHLEAQVIFLSSLETFPSSKSGVNNSSVQSFKTAIDLPAIYQQALCMLYPSVFEGFGLPVLEALWSRLPVITSNISCLPETGGDAAYYVDPYSVNDIANAMLEVSTNHSLAQQMEEKGWQHAQKFNPQKCAADVMEVYLRL